MVNSGIFISFLHKTAIVGHIGYVISFVFESIALFLAVHITLALPSIISFSDIAIQSILGLVLAVSGAVLAVLTLRTDTATD